jgi:hypothetical protein
MENKMHQLHLSALSFAKMSWVELDASINDEMCITGEHSHNGGAGRISSPPFVLMMAGEDSLLRSNSVREDLTRSSGPPKSRLKDDRCGGAEAGRGGTDGWFFGLDLKVLRGGERNASLNLRFVGEGGAEDELSAISSVTMIGRLTGESLSFVKRPKEFVLGRGVGEIRTVRSAMIKE